MRVSRVWKSGNAISICLSKSEAKELGVEVGEYVKVEAKDNKIVIEKL